MASSVLLLVRRQPCCLCKCNTVLSAPKPGRSIVGPLTSLTGMPYTDRERLAGHTCFALRSIWLANEQRKLFSPWVSKIQAMQTVIECLDTCPRETQSRTPERLPTPVLSDEDPDEFPEVGCCLSEILPSLTSSPVSTSPAASLPVSVSARSQALASPNVRRRQAPQQHRCHLPAA